jgi:ABC-type Fe3+ transport system permease subunit
MKRKLQILITMALMLVTLSAQAIVPATTLACGSGGNDPKNQVLIGVGGSANECDSSRVGSVLGTVVSILGWVLGIVAVIMIIVAGFKYVTSGGDAQKAGSAKNTLVYALIGVVIAALAQFLVHFVINQASQT